MHAWRVRVAAAAAATGAAVSLSTICGTRWVSTLLFGPRCSVAASSCAVPWPPNAARVVQETLLRTMLLAQGSESAKMSMMDNAIIELNALKIAGAHLAPPLATVWHARDCHVIHEYHIHYECHSPAPCIGGDARGLHGCLLGHFQAKRLARLPHRHT